MLVLLVLNSGCRVLLGRVIAEFRRKLRFWFGYVYCTDSHGIDVTAVVALLDTLASYGHILIGNLGLFRHREHQQTEMIVGVITHSCYIIRDEDDPSDQGQHC